MVDRLLHDDPKKAPDPEQNERKRNKHPISDTE